MYLTIKFFNITAALFQVEKPLEMEFIPAMLLKRVCLTHQVLEKALATCFCVMSRLEKYAKTKHGLTKPTLQSLMTLFGHAAEFNQVDNILKTSSS